MSHKCIYSWIITHMHRNIYLLVIICMYIYYCIVSALMIMNSIYMSSAAVLLLHRQKSSSSQRNFAEKLSFQEHYFNCGKKTPNPF